MNYFNKESRSKKKIFWGGGGGGLGVGERVAEESEFF